MIVKRINLCALDTGSLTLGYVGENDHTQIRINCASVFADYPAAVVSMTVKAPSGVVYPREVETDGQIVIWTITDSDTASAGNGQIQLTFTEDGTIVKTVIAVTTVRVSLVGDNPPPDPITDWIDEAGEALAKLEGITASATQLPAGEDPTAEIEIVDGHYNIALGIPGGDTESIIDDTAGVGDTTKVWSANKSATDFSELKSAIDSKAPVILRDASGDIVSFTDGADNMPLKECVVQIDPVQSGTGDPAPDNIRSISGHNLAALYVSGKNLLSVDDKVVASHKVYFAWGDATEGANPLYLKAGTYTLSSHLVGADPVSVGLYVGKHVHGQETSYSRYGGNYNIRDAKGWTISEDGYYDAYIYGSTLPNDYHVQMTLAVGNTGYIDHIPVTRKTVTVNWQTAAGTVYGGSLDTVTGVLTVDRILLAIDGTTKQVVFHKTGSAATAFRYGASSAESADGTKAQISNYLHKASQDQTANGKQELAVYANGTNVYMTLTESITTAEAANAYFVTNPLQIVYYLSTPLTYQLDPVQITALRESSIWADTGAISVTYPADTQTYVDSAITAATDPADSAQIKAGTESRAAITPATQDISAFYALAKLAGVDLASQTVTPGTYPDTAKVAIQKMLGIYESQWELIREDTFTNATREHYTISVDGNGLPFELTSIRVLLDIPTQDTESEMYGGLIVPIDSAGNETQIVIDTVTLPANSTERVAIGCLEQNSGMFIKWGMSFSNPGTLGNVRMKDVYSSSAQTYPFYCGAEKIFTSIRLANVKGTMNYRLYGRRKWN